LEQIILSIYQALYPCYKAINELSRIIYELELSTIWK